MIYSRHHAMMDGTGTTYCSTPGKLLASRKSCASLASRYAVPSAINIYKVPESAATRPLTTCLTLTIEHDSKPAKQTCPLLCVCWLRELYLACDFRGCAWELPSCAMPTSISDGSRPVANQIYCGLQNDRFIPARSNLNLDFARYALSKDNRADGNQSPVSVWPHCATPLQAH